MAYVTAVPWRVTVPPPRVNAPAELLKVMEFRFQSPFESGVSRILPANITFAVPSLVGLAPFGFQFWERVHLSWEACPPSQTTCARNAPALAAQRAVAKAPETSVL